MKIWDVITESKYKKRKLRDSTVPFPGYRSYFKVVTRKDGSELYYDPTTKQIYDKNGNKRELADFIADRGDIYADIGKNTSAKTNNIGEENSSGPPQVTDMRKNTEFILKVIDALHRKAKAAGDANDNDTANIYLEQARKIAAELEQKLRALLDGELAARDRNRPLDMVTDDYKQHAASVAEGKIRQKEVEIDQQEYVDRLRRELNKVAFTNNPPGHASGQQPNLVSVDEVMKIVKLWLSSRSESQGTQINEVEIDKQEYEYTHDKQPRGRGTWIFTQHRNGVDYSKHTEGKDHITVNDTFKNAQGEAKAWAKEKGYRTIYVAT
jgi:hypothetical protein